jgi:hypothetical protein
MMGGLSELMEYVRRPVNAFSISHFSLMVEVVAD